MTEAPEREEEYRRRQDEERRRIHAEHVRRLEDAQRERERQVCFFFYLGILKEFWDIIKLKMKKTKKRFL